MKNDILFNFHQQRRKTAKSKSRMDIPSSSSSPTTYYYYDSAAKSYQPADDPNRRTKSQKKITVFPDKCSPEFVQKAEVLVIGHIRKIYKLTPFIEDKPDDDDEEEPKEEDTDDLRRLKNSPDYDPVWDQDDFVYGEEPEQILQKLKHISFQQHPQIVQFMLPIISNLHFIEYQFICHLTQEDKKELIEIGRTHWADRKRTTRTGSERLKRLGDMVDLIRKYTEVKLEENGSDINKPSTRAVNNLLIKKYQAIDGILKSEAEKALGDGRVRPRDDKVC